MHEVPETRYAKSGEYHIAYQVVGSGPIDLVFIPGFISNVEHGWEYPPLAHFFRRLASFARLIVFDKRGTGMSDPGAVAAAAHARGAHGRCPRRDGRRRVRRARRSSASPRAVR